MGKRHLLKDRSGELRYSHQKEITHLLDGTIGADRERSTFRSDRRAEIRNGSQSPDHVILLPEEFKGVSESPANRMIYEGMGNALRHLAYLTTSNNAHSNIQGLPGWELMEHERRMDMGDNAPCERWTYVGDKTAMSPIRLLGSEAARRDHIARTTKDNGNGSGQYGGERRSHESHIIRGFREN